MMLPFCEVDTVCCHEGFKDIDMYCDADMEKGIVGNSFGNTLTQHLFVNVKV
jgi:hypothetical protein